MNAENRPETLAASKPSASKPTKPILAQRKGRGRLGGSRLLDLVAQRGRAAGRRVKILDGDLRSRTLADLYPSMDADGRSIQDGASVPASEELPEMKSWLFQQLDEMATDGISRVLDLGGGDRVMQEFVRDLPLASYCREVGIELVSLYMIGPDVEDFRHVRELIRANGRDGSRVILVLNEGVVRQGQSVDGVFDPVINHPDLDALLHDGARVTFFRRLTCMDQVQASGQGYYDIAAGRPDAAGVKPRATTSHMVKVWLQRFEAEQGQYETVEWLP